MNGFNGLSFQNRHAFAEAVIETLDAVQNIVTEDPEHSLDKLEEFLSLEDQKINQLVEDISDWKTDTKNAAHALGELLILDRILMDVSQHAHVSEYVADVKDGISIAIGNVSAQTGGVEFFNGVQDVLLQHLEDSHDYIGKKWDQLHQASILAEEQDTVAPVEEEGAAAKQSPSMSAYNEAYAEQYILNND